MTGPGSYNEWLYRECLRVLADARGNRELELPRFAGRVGA
jgi:hypothetical protein